MNTRCKVGDMAILITARRQENVGKFCTVERQIGLVKSGEIYEWNGQKFRAYESGFLWEISAKHSFLLGPNELGQDWNANLAVACDHSLLPIRPEDLDDTTDETRIKDAEKEMT